MLTSDQKKAIQDIVGPQWVTDDPCATDTYCIHRNPEWQNDGKSPWFPRPTAVVMPATAQEIAALVRYCNKTGLMVKPLSTGLGPECAVSRDGVIQLDLKRMNKIIDIDVKNQIAVVEPYVKGIRLQTELWKVGLNVNIVSCGGTSSVLASTTSGWGYGFSGPGLGYSGRNYMGAEWISPTGEIITIGSAGHGAGWFSAEGPGPSMRGILRGQWGSLGALGVYTKAAVKLYKWDGPPQPAIIGSNPHYYLRDPLPSNMGFFMLAVPTEQALKDVGYKLGEAAIPYADIRLPNFQQAFVAGGSDWGKVEEVMGTGFFQKMTTYTLTLAVIGHSQREYDWKAKAIKQIVAEVDGASMPIGVKPSIEQLKKIAPLVKSLKNPLRLMRWLGGLSKGPAKQSAEAQTIISDLFMFLLRHASNLQGAYPMPNSFFTLMGSLDTWDKGVTEGHWSDGARMKYVEEGGLIDDGGQGGIGGTYENGHLGYMEALAMYTPTSRRSVRSLLAYSEEATEASIKSAFGLGLLGTGDDKNRRYGPECRNYHEWMIKIKKALDPKTASDPYWYIDPGKRA